MPLTRTWFPLLTFAFAGLFGQQPEMQETSAVKEDPSARAILEAAAKVQTPDGTQPITTYRGTYNVTVFQDEEGKPSSGRSGLIEQTWKKANGKVRYRRVFHNTVKKEPPAHYICNGTNYFYRVEGQDARNMRRDPNLKRELDNLKEEIRRTTEMMNLFFLGNLKAEEITVGMGARDRTVQHPKRRNRTIAVDEIIIGRKDASNVILRIGKKNRLVYEAELVPNAPGGATERFRFGYHKTLSDAQIGKVVVPTLVEYFKGDERVMRGATEIDKLSFNVKVSNSEFNSR